MTDCDILAFTRTKVRGRSCYGCRGMGPRYQAFYAWAHTHSYRCIHDDMPWDFFVILNMQEELEFLDTYKNDFIK